VDLIDRMREVPMTPTTYLSITTTVGCPVQCLKYCPQELITAAYKGPRVMTLDMFRNFMKTIPATTPLYVGGFSEPLMNQDTIAMMEWANEQGYQIRLFTTMAGVKAKDIDRLCAIPYDMFVLHLPDPHGIAHIPMTQEYLENFREIITRVKNLRFMNMGIDFVTNHREDVARRIKFGEQFRNKRTCVFMEYPRYELMPNGEMYFCCECSCLSMRIGNLYVNTYPELVAQHQKLSDMYRNNPDSICQSCCLSEPYWRRQIQITASDIKHFITGGKMIKEIPPASWIWERVFR
jgi:sulfatase maturation enzyme AslB (radical SAM superfamily)